MHVSLRFGGGGGGRRRFENGNITTTTHRSEFFSVRVDPILGRYANRKLRKLFPFENMGEKHRGVQAHLDCINWEHPTQTTILFL